jgi:hypothetical protein
MSSSAGIAKGSLLLSAPAASDASCCLRGIQDKLMSQISSCGCEPHHLRQKITATAWWQVSDYLIMS